MTTYAYARFSQQNQSLGSVERQEIVINAYAEKHNITIDKWFIDKGVSGYNGDQDEVDTAYSELKSVIVGGDKLLIESLSRFSRRDSMLANNNLTTMLLDKITVIACASGTIHDDTPAGKSIQAQMQRTFELESGNQESVIKGHYAKKGHERRIKRIDAKEFTKIRAVGWLSLNNTKSAYVLNDNVKTVRRIFKLCISGLGATKTCQELNQAGIKTFERAKKWAGAGIHHILNNTAAYGCYKGVEDYLEPAIDKNTFMQAQGVIALRRNMRTTRSTPEVNLWVKVAVCAICGERIHVTRINKRVDKWLICTGKGIGNGCTAKNIKESLTVKAFTEILLKIGSSNLITNDKSEMVKEFNNLSGLLEEQIKKSKSITDAIVNGGASDSLIEAGKQIDIKVKVLQDKKDKLESDMLTVEQVEDSRAFFSANLDLETKEGRTAANLHLQRLGVTVGIWKAVEEPKFFIGIIYDVMLKGHLLWHVAQDASNNISAIPVSESGFNVSEKYDNAEQLQIAKMIYKFKPQWLSDSRNAQLEEMPPEEQAEYFSSFDGDERDEKLKSFLDFLNSR